MAFSRVYSTRFLGVAGLNGTTAYVVPVGLVAVVRDIDAYANVSVASRELHIIGAAGQTIWWADWNTGDQVARQWRGRQVLEAGESLTVTTSDLIDVTISGYLLEALP